MLKTLTFIRHNAIALLALFVALGGTSYAALGLPAGSVGTSQLRNGAVTSRKLAKHAVTAASLDPKSIAGYVRDWAEIAPGGQLIASRPRAHLVSWVDTGSFPGGIVSWGHAIPRSCIASATTGASAPATYASASVISGPKGGQFVGAQISLSAPGTYVSVVVICPQP